MSDSDPANRWLLQAHAEALAERPEIRILWLCDENLAGLEGSLPAPREHTRFISNRFDIARALERAGHRAEFSDFDTAPMAPASIDLLVYRLSKEKPLVHYLLNLSQRLLAPGGHLLIAGHKPEGAKALLDKAARQLGSARQTRKLGQAYCAAIPKAGGPLPPPLADDHYTKLRAISHPPDPLLLSKPGQFGWRKIDAGSALLIDCLRALSPPRPAHLLDLGCGYGYLAVRAAALFDTPPAAITLTDNNAATLLSATANAEAHRLPAQIQPGDAGDTLSRPADLLLCNPPFHQGFAVSGDLTEKFLAAAARLTSEQGQALFVVNAFIALEKKARAHFREVATLANNGAFKVLRLTH